MTFAIVALGGNLGDPKKTFAAALQRMEKLGENFETSSFYLTEPVSAIVQPFFLNAVCRFKTELSLESLFAELEAIEKDLGKVKKIKDAPRIIDLDLLFYGDKSYEEKELMVPHPKWKERLFVLIPLGELVEEVVVEGKTWNIKKIIQDLE